MPVVTQIGPARDARITGTKNPDRLKLMVRILSVTPDRNNTVQRAQLAAAQRLLGEKA